MRIVQADKNLLRRLSSFLGSPRCCFNNYSVHCCAHIALRAGGAHETTLSFRVIGVVCRRKGVSTAAATGHVRSNL